MKKLTLLKTYLRENDDPDFRGKINKELGGFKSLLNGDKKDNPDKKEEEKSDSKKKELSEENGFGLDKENPFDDAMQTLQKDHQFNTEPEDAFSKAYNDKQVKEEVIGIEEMEPMDELEHVSLVIHPTDVSGGEVDPLMTPTGGCDSEDASVTNFAPPGGPDFEKPPGNETILIDGGEVKNEAAWTFSSDDVGAEEHFGEMPDDEESFFDDNMEDDGWLQYILEPEEERHNIHSNDLKGSVGSQGTQSTSVTTPTKPTVPTKECSVGMAAMGMKENANNLKNKISKVRKTVSNPNQVLENVNKIKNILKNIK